MNLEAFFFSSSHYLIYLTLSFCFSLKPFVSRYKCSLRPCTKDLCPVSIPFVLTDLGLLARFNLLQAVMQCVLCPEKT